MRRIAIVVLAGMMSTGVATAVDEHAEHSGHGKHEEPEVKIVPQATCPVMGGKVNKDLYVDHEGKRIYACCKGCIKPIQKEFAKYAKKIEAKGEAVTKLQTTCPVMGGKINKKHYADVKGKRIYVCCPGCIGKIKAEPGKYIKKLEMDGVTLDTPPKKLEKSREAHKGHDH